MTQPRVQTVFEALQNARVAGDAYGFTFIGGDNSERKLGWSSLMERCFQRGAALRSFGLTTGDRVAIAIPEPEEFVLTFLGSIAAGLVPVPLYPPLSLGRLDAYLASTTRTLQVARANLLVTTAQVETVLWSVAPKIPTLRDLVTVTKLDAIRSPPPVPAFEVKPEDTLFLQFTSGSTAAPRGVVVTHASLLANAVGFIEEMLNVDITKDVAVSWLPLYHDMGLIGFVLGPIVYRLPAVFIPTLSFLKRPALWMETIHKHRGTLSFAPNFAYARLAKRASDADLARWDLSCVKALGCGAEPIHAGTIRAFTERFKAAKLNPNTILPSYGMAEATLAMTFTGLDKKLVVDSIDPDACYENRKATPTTESGIELVSCGRAMPGHEIAIFDEADQQLGERQIGEIGFRGPSVAAGYYRDEAATKPVFRADGWLRTGDLGYIADGELFISGRAKDILIVNGRNYYPQSIEWLAEEVPGIRKGNIVAFSVPGPSSEEVIVVAETSEKAPAEVETIAAAVSRRINEEMGLSVSEVALIGPGELPKTSSGKLQRRKTREQYLAGALGTEGVRIPGSAAEKLSLAKHVVNGLIGRVRHTVTRRAGMQPEKDN